ncbi:hypothetical protein FV226_05915 [Methylobacterium sp. WL12]|uniref:hypothetical protein n=1 Tax=Methylobacterium sp. WL12 TaxID=2603890 RepID=UPI0011CB132A|nr:hypothetical protein [Methylobacterium sp. WL12]TXM74619.1 hypothetical protein FV226_05915 [Methylobacterium sp. WL12]
MRATWMIPALVCGLAAAPANAADLFGAEPAPTYDLPSNAPRYFPRGDGSDNVLQARPLPVRRAGCLPRRVPVPTNAPDDPSYVGSTYGLSKPSYYGFTPPLGVDDPFGRPLLPYCR